MSQIQDMTKALMYAVIKKDFNGNVEAFAATMINELAVKLVELGLSEAEAGPFAKEAVLSLISEISNVSR